MDTNLSGSSKGISGCWLKIIAVVTMLVDHTAASVLLRMLRLMPAWGPVTPANWDDWYNIYLLLRTIGRMAFPIYCFLLVEGFTYTKSRGKYALRLFIFALISELPFDMALFGKYVDMEHNNVFFTLFLGLLTIMAADRIREYVRKKSEENNGRLLHIAGSALTIAVVLFVVLAAEWVVQCDYGGSGILAIFAVYIFRRYRLLAFAAAVTVLGLLAGTSEFAALLMLIPMYFYNGTRGRQLKYFFYAFYPVHLLILSVICITLGFGMI